MLLLLLLKNFFTLRHWTASLRRKLWCLPSEKQVRKPHCLNCARQFDSLQLLLAIRAALRVMFDPGNVGPEIDEDVRLSSHAARRSVDIQANYKVQPRVAEVHVVLRHVELNKRRSWINLTDKTQVLAVVQGLWHPEGNCASVTVFWKCQQLLICLLLLQGRRCFPPYRSRKENLILGLL